MIQISDTGLEALIQQRFEQGHFATIEDALKQALMDAPLPSGPPTVQKTGADLLAALMNSPHPEVDLEPERFVMPVREPVRF